MPTHYAGVSLAVQSVAAFPARVGFTEGLDDWGLGLLGNMDFFERFRVFFDYSAGYFNLEPK